VVETTTRSGRRCSTCSPAGAIASWPRKPDVAAILAKDAAFDLLFTDVVVLFDVGDPGRGDSAAAAAPIAVLLTSGYARDPSRPGPAGLSRSKATAATADGRLRGVLAASPAQPPPVQPRSGNGANRAGTGRPARTLVEDEVVLHVDHRHAGTTGLFTVSASAAAASA
jgi:hypothetical protein